MLLGLGAQQVERAGHDLVELDGLPLEREDARPEPVEIQDPSDQAEQPVHAVIDRLGPMASLGIEGVRRSPQEELGRGADRRERVSELVRDLREELLLVRFDFSQLVGHAIEGVSEIADFVLRLDRQRLPEAAVRHSSRRCRELTDRSCQAEGDEVREKPVDLHRTFVL